MCTRYEIGVNWKLSENSYVEIQMNVMWESL